jgi:excisionase family DNA binding protein
MESKYRAGIANKTSVSWFTVNSVATCCLVSKITLWRWIRDGKISARRLPGGHYRISVADFRDFLRRYNMPIQEELCDSEFKGKEGNSNGSTDFNGAVRTG